VAGIVIVGTGGMGREAAAWLADAGLGAAVLGFLDDDVATHRTQVAGLPVLGGRQWLEEDDSADVEVVVALGGPAARAGVVDHLDAHGVRMATVVHPSASIGPRCEVREGAIVCPGAVLTCDVTLGRALIVNYGAMVGHDGVVGDAVFLAPGAHLAGNVTVGERADVGIGASVIQGVRIGERAVVGAGTVVIRDVAPDSTVVGVPARPIGGGGREAAQRQAAQQAEWREATRPGAARRSDAGAGPAEPGAAGTHGPGQAVRRRDADLDRGGAPRAGVRRAGLARAAGVRRTGAVPPASTWS